MPSKCASPTASKNTSTKAQIQDQMVLVEMLYKYIYLDSEDHFSIRLGEFVSAQLVAFRLEIDAYLVSKRIS